MELRRVPIEWDDLELALTTHPEVEAGLADAGPRLRPSLQAALGRSRPFRRFKDAPDDDSRERERWFAFRAERLHEAMREWLTDHDIEPTTEPPRRPGDAAPGGAP